MAEYGLMLTVALLVTLLSMPWVLRLGFAWGMVDHPDLRKTHKAMMPRSGGLAIALGFFLTTSIFGFMDRGVQAVMMGAGIILLTGVLDDLWHLRPWKKFLGEILAAIVFIWWSGVSLHSLGGLFPGYTIQLGVFSLPITVIAIVGVINALNLSDGLDGLAAGLAAIACVFLGFFAYISQQWSCLLMLLALFGSLLAFLYYNAHPAKLFMGDTGSLLLGYVLVTTAILLVASGNASVLPISMALVLGLPILDTLLVMLRRLYLGQSPFSPDRTHLHHRLLNLGVPHGAVVSILYTVMTCFGLLAVFSRLYPEYMQLLFGLAMGLLVYGSVLLVSRLGVHFDVQQTDHHESFYHVTAYSGRSIPWMSRLLPLLFLPPIYWLSPLPEELAGLLLFSMLALCALCLLPGNHDRLGIVHGLLYWSVFLLLGILSCYGSAQSHLYLAIITVMVSIWVVIKLIFKQNRRVFLTSGFEILLLIICLLVPYLMMNASFLAAFNRDYLLLACLESVPFLLAMKIVIRRQPHRNRPLMLSLAAVLFVLFTLIGKDL